MTVYFKITLETRYVVKLQKIMLLGNEMAKFICGSTKYTKTK